MLQYQYQLNILIKMGMTKNGANNVIYAGYIISYHFYS